MPLIQLTEKTLRKQLAEAQHWVERFPDDWFRQEALGRCLRWLKEPGAAEAFQRAAASFPRANMSALGHLRLGNLYRLAGQPDLAEPLFHQAYTMLQPTLTRRNTINTPLLVEACFFLGHDEEAEQVAETLRVYGADPTLRAFPIARLAHARRVNDRAAAGEVAEQLAEAIRRGQAEIGDSGGPTLWDWYEIALDLAR